VRLLQTIFSAPARAGSRVYTARSGLPFGRIRTEAFALGARLLRPSRGLAPRQAVCLFGQIETDASLQACAYSGPIVAPHRIKRFVSSVKSRPTHRSRRALTLAQSWPRTASSGLSLRSKSRPTHRSRRALTLAQSWPRTASSGLSLRSNRDRRIAPGVRLLWPNRGPAPRQAVCLFGHDNK
jgi:hypothetical protein